MIFSRRSTPQPQRPRFPVTDAQSSINPSIEFMARPIKNPRPKLNLETEALTALEEARAMAPGPGRTEAMKRAGILRNAADLQGLLFAKRGRPPKT